MVKSLFVVLSLVFFTTVQANANPVDLSKAVSIDTAIKKMGKNKKSQNLLVSGEISSVCQAKGCWLTLKAANEKSDVCEDALKSAGTQADIRVMMKDHTFTVPKDLKGQVVVRGELKKKKISSFQLKHLMKDAGCSKDQMKKAKKSLYKYQIVATDVFKNGKRYKASL